MENMNFGMRGVVYLMILLIKIDILRQLLFLLTLPIKIGNLNLK